MKSLIFIIIYCLITFCYLPLAISSDNPQTLLISDLYKNHSPTSDKYWLDNKRELAKYFNNKLTLLFIKDDQCKIRTQGVCNLNFDPFIGAQDFDNPNFKLELKILHNNIVKATFVNSGNVTAILFKLVKTNSGWKIQDIIYPNGVSLYKVLSGDK